MKQSKFIISIALLVTLSGCGCYDTHEEAWAACNDKYNGKCRYLGDDYKVCKAQDN